jgi:hypothetical protein
MSTSTIKQYFSDKKSSLKEEEERLKIAKEIQIIKNDPKYKLNNYFKELKIFVEIYNNNKEESYIFKEIITNLGAFFVNYLTKGINYIIYKDGRLKTIKYALNNKIKIVNPLWLDDKLNGKFNDDSIYEIKKNFTQINFEEGQLKFNKTKGTKSPNISENIRKKKISIKKCSLSFNTKNPNININKENDIYNIKFINKGKEKVKTISYCLSNDIINYLNGIESIEYNGNYTFENFDLKNKIIDECPVIFIKSDFEKYDWKLIKMLLERKILVEVNIFISDNILKETQSKNMNISIFSLSYFEDLSINKDIKCLIKNKKSLIEKNQNDKIIIDEYYLDEGIKKNEYMVLRKIMKKYLKMKIIDLDFYNKKRFRSKSQSKNMNNKLKNSLSPNDELKYCNIHTDENINDNIIENEEEINYRNIYLLTTEELKKINLSKKNSLKISFLSFKGILSIKYIYDSFFSGINVMNKYYINN